MNELKVTSSNILADLTPLSLKSIDTDSFFNAPSMRDVHKLIFSEFGLCLQDLKNLSAVSNYLASNNDLWQKICTIVNTSLKFNLFVFEFDRGISFKTQTLNKIKFAHAHSRLVLWGELKNLVNFPYPFGNSVPKPTFINIQNEAKNPKFRDFCEINKTVLANIKTISLMDKSLNFLPSEIAYLPSLESLNLNKNKLSGLPSAIQSLQQLKTLYLGQNQFTAIPVSLIALTSLERLHIFHNQIPNIDSEIKALTNLKELNVRHNAIDEISAKIINLKAVESLNFSDNQLKSLPSLKTFQQLKKIDLSNNRFTTPPRTYSLSTEMFLNGNPLKTDTPRRKTRI